LQDIQDGSQSPPSLGVSQDSREMSVFVITNKQRHFMTPNLQRKTSMTKRIDCKRFGVIKPFQKIRSRI
jgi:hypothetical protein